MLKIGLFGLGTVGRGLLEISRNSSMPFEISAIVDRSFESKKQITQNIPASNDPDLILKNPEIDLVVELMGGCDLALYAIREALDLKKNVITANKMLLAEHGFALFSKAQENGLKIGFEAAVAGAIPIIRNLENIFWAEPISLLEGILNGTSNYILTKMRTQKIEYEAALKDAQNLGFAEADPTMDISGMDAAHKLALLSSLITKKWVEHRNIYIRGIENISLNDILWTEKMGFRVRQISRYQVLNNTTHISVEPTIIMPGHYLWDIENENNAVTFKGEFSGNHMFAGKGAGSLPTAYSVVSDIMHFLQGNYNPYLENNFKWHYHKTASLDEKENAFYVRLSVQDEPGVLAKITKILSENSISIASIHQDAPIQSVKNPVDLIIVTHKCTRKSLHKSIEDFKANNSIKIDPAFLAIDESL